jgi:hypothetical protein
MADDADEPLDVLCTPVAWKGMPVVAGCTRRTCRVCGQEVWVSPATLTRAEAHPAGCRFLCMGCAAAELQKAGEDLSVLPVTPEQLAEMRRFIAGRN